MAIDYSSYNDWYHHMDTILRQMQNVSRAGNAIYRNTPSAGQSFSDVFQNAAQNLDVPESMDAVFEEAARLYDVPAALLKAIGKAESNFNADVVSSAGAMGVMQLMPSTAEALGVEDPFDARSNIMGGAKYISDKLKEYDGDVELALASYNAGSGNVAKYGGVPPFKETQNYIRKIKEYMGMDITTGKTIERRADMPKKEYQSSTQRVLDSINTGFSAGNALYMLQMMKLQMQNRMTMVNRSLVGDSEDTLF